MAVSTTTELAQTLIRADTVNPPGNELIAARLVAERLEAAGLDVQLQAFGPERSNVVARSRGGQREPSLCLTGHLDVVGVGAAPWLHDPFGGDLDGARLYGRGSSDMKGGIAAIVAAVERLAPFQRGAGPGIEVVFTAGEETGCEGAAALAQSALLGHVGGVVVAEPTANCPAIAQKGVLWLEAEAKGRLAHGSTPELGENAIQALAEAVCNIDGFSFDSATHGLLGTPTLNVGTFRGGDNINSVPDRAVAGIDIRTIPDIDTERLEADLQACLGDRVELHVRLDLPPVETDARDPWIATVLDVLERVVGHRPEPEGIFPFTDAAVLTPAYGEPPTVICGPGEPRQAHQTDEWCSTQRIEEAVDIYVELVKRWCRL
jgi:succinyl-diaminopimelate desuccinylase